MHRLYLLLSLFFLIPSLLNANAKDRNLQSCPRNLGARFKTHTRDEIVSLVANALEKGERQTLIQYLPCEFMVALPESDVGGFTSSLDVLTDLIDLSKAVKWNGKGKDYKTQFNLPATQSKVDQALVFRKDDESGWYWAGYSTSDEKIAKKLLKTKSLEHHGGE